MVLKITNIMINSSHQDKDKKIEAIGKRVLLWHEACMMGVDKEMLKEPRPMTGAILFFAGSVDNLCQANSIDDITFIELAMLLLESVGFSKDVTAPIITNFYTKTSNSKFAVMANVEGGQKLTDWLSRKDQLAPLAFGAFIREWVENPEIGPEEVYLFTA